MRSNKLHAALLCAGLACAPAAVPAVGHAGVNTPPIVGTSTNIYGQTVLNYSGNAQAEQVSFSEEGSDIRVSTNMGIWIQGSCRLESDTVARCPANGLSFINANGRSGGDFIEAQRVTTIPARINGGPGSDCIGGTPRGGDVLRGGPDDATDGPDLISSTVDVNAAPTGTGDWVSGGGGGKASKFCGRDSTLKPNGDLLEGSADTDVITGESGPDTIYPRRGADIVGGGSDSDAIWADDVGDGRDIVFGDYFDSSLGGSNDQIHARDGSPDEIFCGAGTNDWYQVDGPTLDLIGSNQCEKKG